MTADELAVTSSIWRGAAEVIAATPPGCGFAEPRIFTEPLRELTRETSRGFEVIEFAEKVVGVTLLPWQRWALVHGLELAEDGSFRFRTLLILAARQNGKTVLLQLLALWRIYMDRAPLVIGTAQNLSLAEDSWEGAVSMAEGVPDLASEVAHVSRVNGAKSLRLTSGEKYAVTASSRRGARGLSSDLVLLDELREHRDWDAWGAITKTTMARPSPQIIGFSNAGDRSSVVLASLREKATESIGRPTSLGVFEWSAVEDCDLEDPTAWRWANPALGYRMNEAAIRSALETDPEEVFRTEVLCQWVVAMDAAIAPGMWSSLADGQAQRGQRPTFALDVAPDHSTATIAVAWKRADGATQVQLAEHAAGVDWVVGRAADMVRRWSGRLIVEQTGTGAFLGPQLELAGVPLRPEPRRFFMDACSALDLAVSSSRLRHGNQPALNGAVDVARWSTSGDADQRVLSRKDPRVSPLVAAALAVHGVAKRQRSAQLITF